MAEFKTVSQVSVEKFMKEHGALLAIKTDKCKAGFCLRAEQDFTTVWVSSKLSADKPVCIALDRFEDGKEQYVLQNMPEAEAFDLQAYLASLN